MNSPDGNFNYELEAGRYTRFSAAEGISRTISHNMGIIKSFSGLEGVPRENIGFLSGFIKGCLKDTPGTMAVSFPFCLLFFGLGEKCPAIPYGADKEEFSYNIKRYFGNKREQCESILKENIAFPGNMEEFFRKIGLEYDYRELKFSEDGPSPLEAGICPDKDIYWEHVRQNTESLIIDAGKIVYGKFVLGRMGGLRDTVGEEIGAIGHSIGAHSQIILEGAIAYACADAGVCPSGIVAPGSDEYDPSNSFEENLKFAEAPDKSQSPIEAFRFAVKSYVAEPEAMAYIHKNYGREGVIDLFSRAVKGVEKKTELPITMFLEPMLKTFFS